MTVLNVLYNLTKIDVAINEYHFFKFLLSFRSPGAKNFKSYIPDISSLRTRVTKPTNRKKNYELMIVIFST